MEAGPENNDPVLLSIVIPTRNRSYTCLYAIESVIRLNKKDIEIIVEDCSDNIGLGTAITEKFGNDGRIKYRHTFTKPSMTENWNNAFSRAAGEYICGIGDDDAVLPGIYGVAEEAKRKNTEAIGHSKRYQYFWSDYTVEPAYAGKLIVVNTGMAAEKKYSRNEIDIMLKEQATIPNMDYRRLPMVYHCMLSGKIIRELIKRTGRFLDGTSLDVYSSVALGLLVNSYVFLDEPFTMPGACGSSNSNRSLTATIKNHFNEFNRIDFDDRIPAVHNLTFSIAESTQKAFLNLNNTEYPKYLNLPYLYADFLVSDFSKNTRAELKRLMRENKFNTGQYLRFIKFAAIGKTLSMMTGAGKGIKKILRLVWPGATRSNVFSYKAADILAAVDMTGKYNFDKKENAAQ